jgi:hypothetical protein
VIDQGRVGRQELGVDARVLATSELSFSGLASLATTEGRLSQASLRALWQPSRRLELTLEGLRTAPDLFVSRASIFSVFAEETHDEAGATVYFRPLPLLRLGADGYVISDDSGTGGRGGLRAQVALDAQNATLLGAEGRFLALPINSYVQARAFAVHRFVPRLVATLDLDAYFLREVVNGQDTSFTAAATIGWDFLPGWRGVVTGITGETPLLAWRFEAMAKVVYNFSVHVKEEVK